MSLEEAVYDALSPIVAIGGPGTPRLYRSSLPEGYVLPAITYHRVDTVFEYGHNGDNGLIHARFQVSCWATTNAAALAIARTVQTTFDAWLIAGTRHALPVNQYDVSDPDTGVYQVALDFIIWDTV
jgi:hypothetical protein